MDIECSFWGCCYSLKENKKQTRTKKQTLTKHPVFGWLWRSIYAKTFHMFLKQSGMTGNISTWGGLIEESTKNAV